MTRPFIETIKENITQCKETQATWETRDQAFTWLVDNVEKATDKEIEWDQKFEQGSRIYLVDFQANSVNEKGLQEMSGYTFDLNDIHPGSSKFSVKGKIIEMNLATRGNEKLIKPYKNGEVGDFEDDFVIYVDDILLAKKTLAAFATLYEMCK